MEINNSDPAAEIRRRLDRATGARRRRLSQKASEAASRSYREACVQIADEYRKEIIDLYGPDFIQYGYIFQMIHPARIIGKSLRKKGRDNKSGIRWERLAGRWRAMGMDTMLTCTCREGFLISMIRWTNSRNIYVKKPNDMSLESLIQRVDAMVVIIFTDNRERFYAEKIETLRKELGLGWKHDTSEGNEDRYYLAHENGKGSDFTPTKDLDVRYWPYALENDPRNKTIDLFQPKLGLASRMIQLFDEENLQEGAEIQ